jgi:hypothetical protein
MECSCNTTARTRLKKENKESQDKSRLSSSNPLVESSKVLEIDRPKGSAVNVP